MSVSPGSKNAAMPEIYELERARFRADSARCCASAYKLDVYSLKRARSCVVSIVMAVNNSARTAAKSGDKQTLFTIGPPPDMCRRLAWHKWAAALLLLFLRSVTTACGPGKEQRFHSFGAQVKRPFRISAESHTHLLMLRVAWTFNNDSCCTELFYRSSVNGKWEMKTSCDSDWI
jgi:hypothetical protein